VSEREIPGIKTQTVNNEARTLLDAIDGPHRIGIRDDETDETKAAIVNAKDTLLRTHFPVYGFPPGDPNVDWLGSSQPPMTLNIL
jgi:hypothetical protein